MYPRGSQPNSGLFSEEEKQEYIQIEYLAPEGALISNQYPEGGIYTIVIVTWSDKVEGSGENIDATLCGRLYKEEDYSLVTWSGKYPNDKMKCFTCSK